MDSIDPEHIGDMQNLLRRAMRGQADTKTVLHQLHSRLQPVKEHLEYLRNERGKLLSELNEKNKYGG
jgi:hypothetical protein